ncbi:MAG: MurNAc alpha-1-phosphate uridylyltransferase [Lysobacterales bacterium]|jgi:MurNAc alpha-1-phosphate uridylyltransferase
MILAAGRGDRLRPLTDTTPKPLLKVAGQALIFHHLDRLAASGFKEVVINLGHLGNQLEDAIGSGDHWGLTIQYSREPEGALETGGGIAQALPLLSSTPFLVVNGDIFCDFDFARLRSIKCDHAHLVLVSNPEWLEKGDFSLQAGRIRNSGIPMHTFSGISVYHPRFFEGAPKGKWSVVPLLRQVIDQHLVTGEIHGGEWHDVGTQERLEQLNIAN